MHEKSNNPGVGKNSVIYVNFNKFEQHNVIKIAWEFIFSIYNNIRGDSVDEILIPHILYTIQNMPCVVLNIVYSVWKSVYIYGY